MKIRNRFKGSLKAFIIFWVSLISLSIITPSIAIFITAEQLQSYIDRTLAESKAVEATYILEFEVLTHGFEDLYCRLKQDRHCGSDLNASLALIEENLKLIVQPAVSEKEQLLIDEITNSYQAFKLSVTADSPESDDKLKVLTGDLLKSVTRYRDRHRNRISREFQMSSRMDRYVELWPIGLVLGVMAIVAIGALTLLKRIMNPTIQLSRAAAMFGNGDFSARAPVMREDELGRLCRTFNNMADDIARREKDRLESIASVVHDIKNPLIVIGGAARMLSKKKIAPDQQGLWLDRIVKQIETLQDMMHDLMDTVQVATGHLSLQVKETDLAKLVQRVKCEQAAVITSHRIVFDEEAPCLVSCDERRMERIIVNLISNAVKYSPEQTEIFLKVATNKSAVVVSVRDHGVGIEPEDLNILFQPFGRLRRTREMAKGSGMGLFTVKKLIDAHNGTIMVTSSPGDGTTVKITLPV